jgi:acetyltransferase-like isoleucine patch superfamily enzyme
MIGDGVRLTAQVAITDTKHRFRCNSVGAFVPADDEVLPVTIGRNTFVGTGAVIEAGTRLGAHCVVGANSYVRGYFADGSILAGAPARLIGQRCILGGSMPSQEG